MCGTCGSRTQIYLIANEKSILRNSPINKKGSFLGSLNYNLCYIFLLAPTIYSHLATISCRKHREYNIKPIPFHFLNFIVLLMRLELTILSLKGLCLDHFGFRSIYLLSFSYLFIVYQECNHIANLVNKTYNS